ncbi:MAG TPA: sigma-70 family RNA polymerase sigma factor [Ignavibacteriaceae bacterium]|nr:sigma-70 family RNA polymerase sigma factor [Ignavibacteriaceae bacterium]
MTETQTQIIERAVKKEKNRLFNFIRKRVPEKEDAEDILQDVFFQFVSAFEEIEIIEKISSWLFRTARNKITDSYRKKKEIPLNGINLSGKAEEEEVLMLEEILPDPGNSPEEELIRSLIWEEIENALNDLPEEQREIFIMNEFEGLSFKEISEITEEPVNTLLSRKRYAVLYLRKKLQHHYKELENV